MLRFCFVLRAFLFMHNLFEKVLFLFVLELFICLEVVCPALTQTHMTEKDEAWLPWSGMPCSPCTCLPLMTKAAVGRELCEGFCQDLTFGYRKITGPLDGDVNSHSFQSFWVTITLCITLQSTYSMTNVTLFYISSFFLFVFVAKV